MISERFLEVWKKRVRTFSKNITFCSFWHAGVVEPAVLAKAFSMLLSLFAVPEESTERKKIGTLDFCRRSGAGIVEDV